MKQFRITLKHDGGTIRIITTASSATQAIKQVISSEYRPLKAVKKVETLRTFW
jgi:hypothetical protein